MARYYVEGGMLTKEELEGLLSTKVETMKLRNIETTRKFKVSESFSNCCFYEIIQVYSDSHVIILYLNNTH